MKCQFLAAASALALLLAAPALAADNSGQNMRDNWNDTKKSVSDAADDVSRESQETYQDIRAALIDDNAETKIEDITINRLQTVDGMLGSNITNANGETIGKVHDIILDNSGRATMVIVADGDFFGMGKKAAFDYSVITRRNQDGDVIAPLTEEMIDRAVEFSYEDNASGDNVRLMPRDAYSADELLDGQLVRPNGDTVAEIDNIFLRGGRAHQLIVGFDKMLGMGGKKAALGFSDAKIIKDGEGYDFQLTENQAAQFDAYKRMADNKQ
ncbi:MAG: PRC-barrel domain-containing protein [Alphaproteobacteria bacterium]|nr:PRC-barrel domain-containing protein [Alphaproteobacteria bacterium]